MARLQINTGDRFGKLAYLHDAERRVLPSGQKIRVAHCKCDCGNEVDVLLVHLVRLRTTTCGCGRPEQHGDTHTPLYNTWRAMRDRCSKNHFQSQYYFEKGIQVCQQWKRYVTFKKWAMDNGFRDDLQIDRIENSKGYYPENCRFVTQEVNLSNRDITVRVNYYGRVEALSILCSEKGYSEIRCDNVRLRILRGWSAEKAIDTPTRKGNYSKGKKLQKL